MWSLANRASDPCISHRAAAERRRTRPLCVLTSRGASAIKRDGDLSWNDLNVRTAVGFENLEISAAENSRMKFQMESVSSSIFHKGPSKGGTTVLVDSAKGQTRTTTAPVAPRRISRHGETGIIDGVTPCESHIQSRR